MLKNRLKQRIRSTQLGALFALPLLGLIPAAASASMVIDYLAGPPDLTFQGPDEPSTYGAEGWVRFEANMPDTSSVWFELTPSTTTPDEQFNIKLNNYTGAPINQMYFELRKLNGGTLPNRPTLDQWVEAMASDQSGGFWIDTQEWIYNDSTAQRFKLTFAGSTLGTGQQLKIWSQLGGSFGDWLGFNDGPDNFLLNIDWNEENPVTLPPGYGYLPTPIPGALWLFGSAMVGLLGLSRGRVRNRQALGH